MAAARTRTEARDARGGTVKRGEFRGLNLAHRIKGIGEREADSRNTTEKQRMNKNVMVSIIGLGLMAALAVWAIAVLPQAWCGWQFLAGGMALASAPLVLSEEQVREFQGIHERRNAAPLSPESARPPAQHPQPRSALDLPTRAICQTFP